MGSRFNRRNFGLSPRSPARPRSQNAALRILLWLGMLVTIAAGVIYLSG